MSNKNFFQLKHYIISGAVILCLMAIIGAAVLTYTRSQTEICRTLHNTVNILNPHYAVTPSEHTLFYDLHEGLMTFSADAKHIPGCIKSWPEISKDELTYTFELKDNLFWSDGKRLTANDFIEAWRHAIAPETRAPNAFLYLCIKNVKNYFDDKVSFKEIGMKALSDKKIQIDLEHPTPHFLKLLTLPVFFPIRKDSVYNIRSHKNERYFSNGPYKLVSHDYHKFTLEKNPFYWGRRDVAIQRVVYLLEDHHILHKFRSDEVDITSIPSWEISWTKRNLPEQLHVNKYLKTYAYVFNFRTKAIANNPKLREALSLAIDRSKISQMINMGEYSPAYELIPPGVPSYEYAQFFVPQMLQEERENKAKKLYEEGGYSKKNPLFIEVRYHTSEESCKVADLIAKMWRDVLGVKVKLVRHRWLSYEDFKMCDFTFDVLKHSWVMHYIDPCAILQQFTSHLIGQNISGYSNKIFDQLVEEAMYERNRPKRMYLYAKAEKILLDDHVIIPLYYQEQKNLVSARIGGWVDNILNVHLSKYLYIK